MPLNETYYPQPTKNFPKQKNLSRTEQRYVSRTAINIGVAASKFLGVRRIFARISPNLPESCATFAYKFSPTQITKAFIWCEHQEKMYSFVFLKAIGRHYLKSHNVARHFCPDFQGFFPDF